MENLQQAIDQYCDFFVGHVRAIRAIAHPLYKKMLVAPMLDTLSIARFPQVKNNRRRFIEGVRALGGWKDGERVSLVQLAMDFNTSDWATDLGGEVARRFGGWDNYAVIRITQDPEIGDLRKFATTPAQHELLVEHQHVNLLYNYRCLLVHEFREPGYDFGLFGDDATPYYANVDDDHGRHHRELTYPGPFFTDLAANAVATLRAYLKENCINPYDAYEFGSRWLRRRRRKKATS